MKHKQMYECSLKNIGFVFFFWLHNIYIINIVFFVEEGLTTKRLPFKYYIF